MKLTKSMLIVTLASGMLWAQAPANQPAQAPSKNPTPASKNGPPAKTPQAQAKPAAKAPAPKPGTASAGTAAKTPANAKAKSPAPIAAKATTTKAKTPAAPTKAAVVKKPALKPVPVKKPAVAKVPMKVPAKVAVKKSPEPTKAAVVKPASVKEQASATHVGRMRDPFVSPVVRTGGNLGSGCDTGKRCLVVDQIVLKGIVKSPSGFIAVVENPAKRAYFMRENDPVFNGKVVKITGDTIVFQEQVTDKVGKQSMREVVKKVNAPVV